MSFYVEDFIKLALKQNISSTRKVLLTEIIDYIKSKMTSEGCDLEPELPMYSEIGSLYQPRDLFIPTNDFIQHQIDEEQGVQKLLEKPDFPIDLGHN